MAITYCLAALFFGMILGGFISGHTVIGIVGVVLFVVDVIISFILYRIKHKDEYARRSEWKNWNHLTFEEKWKYVREQRERVQRQMEMEGIDFEEESQKLTEELERRNGNSQSTASSTNTHDNLKFDIYSLDEFCKHAKSCVYSWYDLGVPDNFDFPEMREGIMRVMELEKISFETFIRNFETISQDYHKWGKHEAVAIKYNLCQPLDFFASYMRDKRAERISMDGFYRFLAQEAIDSKVYESNLPDEGEDPVSAALDGKLVIGERVKSDEIQRYIDILKYVLDKDDKSLVWLSNNISSIYQTNLADWYDKYDIFSNPNLNTVLNWFWVYYYYETHTI